MSLEIQRARLKRDDVTFVVWSDDPTPVINWILENGGTASYYAKGELDFDLDNDHISMGSWGGSMLAAAGDVVILDGEHFFPCRPGDFKKLYDIVTEEPSS